MAAQDIAAGTKLTPEMLTLKEVPEDLAFPSGFRTVDEVVDQVTTVPITAGEQVIANKVTATGEEAIDAYGGNPPLAVLVTEGMRAVSVEVNSIVGAGGLVRPGDRVDVILTVRTNAGDDGQGKNQIAATVLQDLQVLAIDQDVAAPGATVGEEENNPEAVTATLLASPVEAEVLVLADGCRLNFDGRLGLAVRSIGDENPIPVRSEWPTDGRAPDCASLFGLSQLP